MKFFERVRVATTLTGTGPATCGASAISAEYRTLAAAGGAVGDVFPYEIGVAGSAEWEGGLGTITAISSGAVTFSRTPTASSNAGALVNFSAGAKEVVCTPLGATLTKWENGTSARLVFASSLLVSDSTLGMTPSPGVDQAAKAQALLDLAANGPLTLIWDVACSLGSTLRARSNTAVKALHNCGAVMLAKSNVPMWRNYNPTKLPGSIVDQNISFEGGIWHGNLGTMTASDQVTLFDFYGVNNISAGGGIEFRKAAGFAFRVTNAVRITVDGYVVDHGVGNTMVSTDGIHVNGPASHIRIARGRHYNGADDGIALNADDGWGAITPGPLDGSYGAITDVTIDDIEFQTNVCGVRLLSGGSPIDNVSISNIKGKTGAYIFVADNFNPAQTQQTGPGNIGTVRLSNVATENVPVSGWGKMAVHLNCKIGQFIFENVTKSKLNNELFPSLRIGEKADIGQLVIDKYISRPTNGATYLTKQIHFVAGSKVGQVMVTNSMFYAPSAVTGCPISIESGATIDQMMLVGNVGRNFTDFVENSGSVGSLTMPAAQNVMSAGSSWAFEQGYSEQSSSSITYTGSGATFLGVKVARKVANDAYNGNVQVSDIVTFTGTVREAMNAALLARGSNLQPYNGSTRQAYVLDVNKAGNIVTLQRSIGGNDTVIGQVTVGGAGIEMSTAYRCWLTAKDTAISARIQRMSDGYYLQPNGTFAATAVDCCAGTDAGIPAAAGQAGVYAYTLNNDGSASGITYANFNVAAAP